MAFTAHSEYHPLSHVVLNHAARAFGSKEKIEAEWEGLAFTSAPRFNEAVKEYEAFEAFFIKRGIAIDYLPASGATTLDAIYCRDASLVTNHGVIVCNMGKLKRKAEPQFHARFFRELGIPVLGTITAPGALEGGDTAWLDEQTLAVGHSYRTNEAGIGQLRDLLDPFGIELIVADLPHFRGPSDVFHLMSVLSPIDKQCAVTYSPLLPIRFRKALQQRGYQFIEVPDEEFESLGCNVFALAPKCCLLASGNPRVEEALRRAGCKVLVYKGNEISLKGGGGPTCLTRPLKRQI